MLSSVLSFVFLAPTGGDGRSGIGRERSGVAAGFEVVEEFVPGGELTITCHAVQLDGLLTGKKTNKNHGKFVYDL